MINLDLHHCTVCGSISNSKHLFEIEKSTGCPEEVIHIYKCGKCLTVYLGKYNENFDDGLYAYYEKDIGKTKEQIYDPLTKESYLKVLQYLKKNGCGKSILDVGCGNGSFIDAALEYGYEARGIELSQPAVDIAQGFNLPVINMDFFSSKIDDSSFDVITMFEVIEHLPKPIEFIKRAAEVVKPGGLIYLTTPNFNSLDHFILRKSWKVFHREHLSYFTPNELINSIKKSTDLEIVQMETRNISLELINQFRHASVKFFTKKNTLYDDHKIVNIHDSGMRIKIAKSPWLLFLKRLANFVLNRASLGSTIILLLRRPS
jgi:2-polyprenyl-3-methyl-5-hydroxy-6-metoxy-1,4-benzoquinol methylase